VFGRRPDERPALERALQAADRLKPGSWESVEALALLSIAAKGRPEAATLYESARQASTTLLDGSWDGIRALACLVRAERELH
jgi:hypothetical protein